MTPSSRHDAADEDIREVEVEECRRAQGHTAGEEAEESRQARRAEEVSAEQEYGRRADLGGPIDGFFAKQPPHLRAILEALRALIEETAPEATASIKWGMPFYTVGGAMMCALGGFKSHVNLVLAGPPDAFADPKGMLQGDAKGGRHLKLRALEELPRQAVRGWLRAANEVARAKGGRTS